MFPVLMFAAGFGTRMRDLTKDKPKPLIEVSGKPLIDHAHDIAFNASCSPIAANLHYKADLLARHLAPKGVLLSEEVPDILETGGGLRNALPLLGSGPVVTLNTDAVWSGPNPIKLLAAHWQPETMDGLLITIPAKNAVGHHGAGDFVLSSEGMLSRGPGEVYGGVQVIKTDTLSVIQERVFSLNLVWDQLLAAGRLFGVSYPGQWCDVGHPEGIQRAEKMLKGDDV